MIAHRLTGNTLYTDITHDVTIKWAELNDFRYGIVCKKTLTNIYLASFLYVYVFDIITTTTE